MGMPVDCDDKVGQDFFAIEIDQLLFDRVLWLGDF